MKLFGLGKEVESEVKANEGCCCGGKCNDENMAEAEVKKGEAGIKILGSGCAKCNALEAATKEAMETLGIDEPIDHVKDFAQIAAYGVMSTPALVVDGKVASYGKVLKREEVITILQKIRG